MAVTDPDAADAGASQRPWPTPRRPWALAMRWNDLLFMHWPVPPAALRPLIPRPLAIDTFDGEAWLGSVPFHMTGVRPHYLPSLPWLSAFPELNVRTYVTIEGKPGVWFFSLDAANPVAVRAARGAFHLPYYDARMASVRRGDTVRYTSRRTHRHTYPADFAARYRPTGPVFRAAEGTVERWLTARYCLYAATPGGMVWRGEIAHADWPLQPAEVEVERDTMTAPLRLAPPAQPPLLHFARQLDVVAWTPDTVRTGDR